MKTLRPSFAAAALVAFGLAPAVRAQLNWSVFNETATTPAPASTATSGVAVAVPAGQRATLLATNFVPVDLTAGGTEVYVTVNFKVSGGVSNIGGGTRAIGFGLYNNNGTATDYGDDKGYFTWLNGRATGSLIELRRRNGDGTSPSLLNPTGTAFNGLGTGSTVQTTGALTDGNSYAIQLHLMGRNPGVSFGNTSSTTTGAGVWVSGDGLSQTAYTNPDNPPATYVFNELGFMFLNSTAGDVTLTINSVTGLTAINAPAIATQPAAISVNPGQTGTLTVGATGTAPLAYQWRKDGTALAGATSATLSLANATAADAGSYTVVVTNAYGTVTSAAAAVTVTTSPIPATIVGQPASVTLNAGQNASFSVAAFGSSPVAYQWRKDGVALAGATASTLALTNVTAADAGSYTVVVSNSAGTATSTAATLTVNTAPAITTQPVGATVAVGQNVTFTVAATGSPAPTYQWQRNGANLAGATSATLALTNVQLANAGVYTVRVVNSVGAATSTPVLLAIPSAMSATAFAPAAGASGVNVDTPLRVTFDRAPAPGNFGRIRIYKASDNSLVDTLDMGVTPYRRRIGTQTVDFIFRPVIVTDNTAAIYPHAGVLEYGQKYYVTLEPGAVLDATGATFNGIADPTAWTFTTKAAGPAADATAVTVAADGSGDFTTVQGAIDWVPLANTVRRTVTVKKGLYNEIIYVGSQKPFITVRGEDRALTEIAYANNANFNTLTGNNRAMFNVDASDFWLETITLHNTTPAGGSQAEALRGSGSRCVLNRVNLVSLQDTLLWNNSLFVTDSYIEGDVDFMWSAGGGPAYFQRTELKMMRPGYYTQIRNGAANFGFIYVDCRLTAPASLTSGGYLGRIDPNPGNFPYSQCLYLNCAMGPHVEPAGWLLNNATSSATIQYWEYKSTDLAGATLDVTKRISSSRQLGDAEAALWRNPAFVLGGWVPQIAPTIETSPAATSAVAGSNVRLTVTANGAPQPALQWFKGGVAIPGATDATLLLANVQPADAGSYTVTATSPLGSVTSAAAALTVTRGAFAGVYFGSSGSTSFALYVRDDGTGVFLANVGSGTALISRGVSVDSTGRITTAASSNVTLTGTISSGGALSGSYNFSGGGGAAAGTFSGTRAPATGVAQSFAGYYQTGANNSSATANLIVSADGQAFALVQTGATLSAGSGTADAAGRVSVTVAGGTNFTANIASGAASATATITPVTGAAITTAGAADGSAGAPRFREFAARSVVSQASATSVGFTITGDTPNSVLIRAIGPTLGDAFAVSGALPNPRLDIYRGSTLIATNTNWTTSPTAADAALAASQVGAFPLRAAAADSALRLTLAPGPYTAVVSSASNATSGASLVEVYDVSNGAAGQRLVNLSVSGLAGTGTNGLVAGVVVTGTQPKRLLLRAAGPALAAFGVSTPLARPILSLYRGTALVATNTGWSTSADASAIASAAAEARAFPFASGNADSAILVNLLPGLYTAIVSSPDATTGTALIEVYELP